ncbi:MAG: hypothetical protein E7049_03130 [Lentisphaerae bacterium]|nr:hypothetical protein [Lentisphaerota bacterium]
MNMMIKVAAVASLFAACGCATSPVAFKPSSVPVPPQGYTVSGSDVTGSSDQIWVLGLGGSLGIQQHRAYKSAMGMASGADALVGMSIESHGFMLPPFFMIRTITVTGTPVKFNPPPSK